MYEKLIEAMKVKGTFDLTWSDQTNVYSEGDIEDTILKIITENEPEDYTESIHNHFCWSVYYHLTHLRKNILNWYPFEKGSSILEIGCGMGALTGTLCEKCGKVTAVELSERRAAAALLRCRKWDNLKVIVGNLNDIIFEEKFDYITLIGVLEYQGSYTDSRQPYQDFLRKVKELLKPGGKLLIAIENQYGLKYWCGAREDHSGIPFDGINRYQLSDGKVRTFSKAALKKLIKESGFAHSYFYYPMPDYKLPTVIYSEEHMPSNGNMQNMQCYYAPDKKTLIADERGIYWDVIRNGVFDFFANSFLVECSDSGDTGEVVFCTVSSERRPEYQIATRFFRTGNVEKIALWKGEENRHLRRIAENQNALMQRGLFALQYRGENFGLNSDRVKAPLLEEVLLQYYKKNAIEKIFELYDYVYGDILKSSDEISDDENVMLSLNMGIVSDRKKYGPILKTGYLDMIPRNAFMVNQKLLWFDQEWTLDAVPANYILYRAISEFYAEYPFAEDLCPRERIIDRYRLGGAWNEYRMLEQLFIGSVTDSVQLGEDNAFRGCSSKERINSINKLLK